MYPAKDSPCLKCAHLKAWREHGEDMADCCNPARKDDDSIEIEKIFDGKQGCDFNSWGNDEIQFARLLSEIRMFGVGETMWDTLLESMSLESGELDELFSRAESKWYDVKKGVCDV